MRSSPLRSAAGVAVFLAAASAHANGRFPAAAQLVVDPDDADHVVVQVTYGLVSTRDAGATWEWTCERALGSVEAFDPPVQIATGGVVLAALLDGLARSSADGCTWTFVDPSPERAFAVDVSVSRGDPDDVIVLTTDTLGGDTFDSRVLRGTPTGAIEQVGEQLPDDFIGATIDVAPSDPERVYITGFVVGDGAYPGVFGRSDDGGETFTIATLDGTDASSGPFLAAVDPVDPDVLYIRTTGEGGRILRSDDGGDTWSVIFEGAGALLGFALSPDGTQIVVGGDRDPVHRGPSEGGAFEQVNALYPKCLTWYGDDVYACASEAFDGFTVGRSRDEGATFEPLYSRFCTSGPLDCGTDTVVGDLCDEDWEVLRTTIQADACFGTGGAGGSTSAGESVAAGTASSGSGTGSGGGNGDGARPEASSGCCTVAAGSTRRADAPVAAIAAAISTALLVARRRLRS
jgi:photosystem II stability/assembly factor-like uncharacterized protein